MSILKFPNVTWSFPLLFQYDPVYIGLKISLRANKIDQLGESNVFSCPACAWSGGRPPSIYGEPSAQLINRQFELIKEYEGIPAFTFTNRFITKNDL